MDELEYTVLVDRNIRLLVIDDEAVIREVFTAMLKDSGYHLDFASTGEKALELMEENEFNLLVVDKNLPDMSGLDVIEKAKELNPDAVSVVITGYSSFDSAVEALRLGATYYLEKPFENINLVQEKINLALKKQHLAHENRVLADHLRSAHQELKALSESTHQTSPQDTSMRSPHEEEMKGELEAIKNELQRVANLLFQASSRFSNLVTRRTIDRQELTQIQAILEKACIQVARRTMGNK
jgi:DNA-binding NtrC family response regulator